MPGRAPSLLTVLADVDVADPAELDLPWLRARLAESSEHLPRPISLVTIRVVSDQTMSALHLRHCGDASTTDVLTFAAELAGEFDDSPSRLGDREVAAIAADIAVCVDVARRAAAERGHAPRRELLLYALHGLLHCCGHEDHDPAAFAAMHAEEDRILVAIGVGATFGETP